MQSYLVSGGRTRTCDLWIMRPKSYQLLHPDILYLKIPPAFTSGRYYYNSILNVINITKIQITYVKQLRNELMPHLHRRLKKEIYLTTISLKIMGA